MTEETTTDQLAEIEGQTKDTPATGYTPPEGWRVLAVGERLRDGDMTVRKDGYCYSTERVGGWVGSNQRYIRLIEPQPEPEPEPEPEPDAELQIRLLKQANDSQAETIGRLLSEARDLNMEIGGLERRLSEREARIRDLETMHAASTQAVVDAGKVNDKLRAQDEELRSEVSYVQRLLGESRQRVTQLEELVASLRTINEGAEKAVSGAGVVNDSLRLQLAAVKAELASVAADRQRLQIELDAAHQVPADSPELRQLRADLAEVAHDRDTYRHEHELLVQDIDAMHQRTKAETVEAIAEWLEPIRREDPHLRAVILFHLPKIIRSLTGLNTPEDVD